MSQKVKIYALINGLTDAVFYIGATIQPIKNRVSNHVSSCIGTKKTLYIHNECDGKVDYVELDEVELKDAPFWEEFYIHLYFSFGFDLIQRRSSFYKITRVAGK